MPVELVDYLAEQLEIADSSCVKSYAERAMTRLEHQWEVRRVEQWRGFAEVSAELGEWVEAWAWTTGDGPKALFDALVAWLRERRYLVRHSRSCGPVNGVRMGRAPLEQSVVLHGTPELSAPSTASNNGGTASRFHKVARPGRRAALITRASGGCR